ncbi:MAG: superoxide dismutase [Bacteroidetes bacterium]|nr:superoxide dismutase [Bacteroidota bacterium]
MKTKHFGIFLLTSVIGSTGMSPDHPTGDPTLGKVTASLEFAPLPYANDALEPFIDKMTMEIHHDKHHKAYYDNFLKSIAGTDMAQLTLGNLMKNISKYPVSVRNNAGGYYNHLLFWQNMAPAGSTAISPEFQAVLVKKFGSLEEFKKQFSDAGKTRFGSGWAWLSEDDKGELFISSTANQDNPLMDVTDKKGIPLLALDVWEHAYYLKYQNRRADYIDAWWNVVNWKTVEERYKATR